LSTFGTITNHLRISRSIIAKLIMSHDRRYQQAQEDEHYNTRSSSRHGHGGNGYYDDQQGNPYANYDQQPQQQDYGYGYNNGGGRDQQVARNRDRDRYDRSDDDDYVSASFRLEKAVHIAQLKTW